jgi:hypothetical protein
VEEYVPPISTGDQGKEKERPGSSRLSVARDSDKPRKSEPAEEESDQGGSDNLVDSSGGSGVDDNTKSTGDAGKHKHTHTYTHTYQTQREKGIEATWEEQTT